MLSEAQIQRAVVMLLEANVAPGVIYWHVPNGGHRNLIEAARFKKQGVKAGVPDLCFVLPDGGRAAFLELKKPKAASLPSRSNSATAPWKPMHDGRWLIPWMRLARS